MNVIEVAPRVWASWRYRAVPDRPDPADAAAAGGMSRRRSAEFLAGRSLLRDLLARVQPGAARAAVSIGGNGKPGLAGWPCLGISISHDGDRVAAGVAFGRTVGIDVQLPERTVREGLIAKCAGRHAGQLAGLDPADRACELAWIWTAQEACVKAEGTGLAGCPWSIDVPPGRTHGAWQGLRWRSLREVSPIPLSCAWKETP